MAFPHATYHTHAAVKLTACGHSFGINCLCLWLYDHKTCPTCRRELFPAPRGLAEQCIDRELEHYNAEQAIWGVTALFRRVAREAPECFVALSVFALRCIEERMERERLGREREGVVGDGEEESGEADGDEDEGLSGSSESGDVGVGDEDSEDKGQAGCYV